MIYLYACGFLVLLSAIITLLIQLAARHLAAYGPCSVQVNDRAPFVIEGGGSLLDALYAEGVFIPSACGGHGTCAFCKLTVLAGSGSVLPTERPYLTCDEVRRGIRLACRVKVKQDIVVRVRSDVLEAQRFRASVAAARMLTHDTREIRLQLLEPGPISFEPGQYVQVEVPGTDPLVYRAYSITSLPVNARSVELLVRHIPGGVCSSFLHAVAPGDTLSFTGPYGDFRLAPGRPLVCVAGGCGVAPVRSIVQHLAAAEPDRSCHIFIGVNGDRDLLYEDEFRRAAMGMPQMDLHYVMWQPGRRSAWQGETGPVHLSVETHLPSSPGCQVFLCGPPEMGDAVTGILEAKGIAREAIYRDEF